MGQAVQTSSDFSMWTFLVPLIRLNNSEPPGFEIRSVLVPDASLARVAHICNKSQTIPPLNLSAPISLWWFLKLPLCPIPVPQGMQVYQ